MSATPLAASAREGARPLAGSSVRTEPRWVRVTLIGLAVAFLGFFLILPLVAVFYSALRDGLAVYARLFEDPAAASALRLTLLTAAITLPVNVVFGLAAAWCLSRYRFPGRRLMISLIDLPFTVSPVVAGLVFVLLLGSTTVVKSWLYEHGVRVIFAVPGIVIATMFVTFPFVARELLPLMEAQGEDEELAALSLGAGGWATFLRVTLPKVKWGLIYGVILCNARAMGEFGAVSVVSGLIRGRTCTLPLHIEILYNEYAFTLAFATASLLALLAVATLVLKELAGRRAQRALKETLR
jgi:sulfate/thiosulfate transport system permease protein